jgi:hypothetical protein
MKTGPAWNSRQGRSESVAQLLHTADEPRQDVVQRLHCEADPSTAIFDAIYWGFRLSLLTTCGSGGTADALASGASWSNPVGVRIPPSAPTTYGDHQEHNVPAVMGKVQGLRIVNRLRARTIDQYSAQFFVRITAARCGSKWFSSRRRCVPTKLYLGPANQDRGTQKALPPISRRRVAERMSSLRTLLWWRQLRI